MNGKPLPDEEAICTYLQIGFVPSAESKIRLMTGFIEALISARKSTGRNPNTGEKVNRAEIGNWLGAVG